MKIIEASLLAFSRNKFKIFFQLLRMKLKKVNQIHYDVMDGIFVPNKAFFKEHLKLLKFFRFKISIHLMVQDPVNYIEFYKKIRPNFLTFHLESISNEKVLEILNDLKQTSKIKSGVAIKPNTDLNQIMNLIHASDIITIMSVEPGRGGQKFIENTVERINYIRNQGYNSIIQVDGGINIDNIKKIVNDADFFVSGTFLINYKGNFKNIYNLLKKGEN